MKRSYGSGFTKKRTRKNGLFALSDCSVIRSSKRVKIQLAPLGFQVAQVIWDLVQV